MFLLVFPDLLRKIYARKEVCFRWGAEGSFPGFLFQDNNHPP